MIKTLVHKDKRFLLCGFLEKVVTCFLLHINI